MRAKALRFVVFYLSLITYHLSLSSSSASAAQPATAAVLPSGFIVTQFAVPVAVPQYAVPVAPQSYVQYGGGGYSTSSLDSLEDRIAARVIKAMQNAGAIAPTVAEQTLVTRTCTSCHGGSAPKAKLDLSDLSKLQAADRLRAIGAVLADDPAERMPPESSGKKLSAEDLGKLLQELSQTPKEVHP